MSRFRGKVKIGIYDASDTSYGFTSTSGLWTRISDGQDALAINTDGSINVNFAGTVTVSGVVEVNTITADSGFAVDVNTITATGNLGVSVNTFTADDLGVSLNTITASGQLGTSLDTITADGIVKVDVNTNTAQTPGLIDVNTVTASGNLGTSINTVTATGRFLVDLNTNTAQVPGLVNINTVTSDSPILVSRDSNQNTETNPIYVQVVSGIISGDEVHYFVTANNVAESLTSNMDFSVTAGATFLCKSVIVSASGAGRYEVQPFVGGTATTTAMLFTNGPMPTYQAFFDPAMEASGTMRIIARNDDDATMSMYATFIGTLV